MAREHPEVWDFIIVGSGFGGSVSALRLAEKGYSVLVLEKGQRWEPEDYPLTNWNLKRWLWLPALGFRGFFKMTFFRHLTVLSGVGVGGGSLVYANTLPVPGEDFFTAPGCSHLADWWAELEPHYRTAQRMLGVARNPVVTHQDRALKAVAEKAGIVDGFGTAPVGVYFGEPNVTVPDPYHGGEGPERTGCTHCGACMTGCRHGAKNTLDRNYLWLAEARGATIRPDTEVRWIRPLASERGAAPGDGSAPPDGAANHAFEVTALERIGPFRTRTFRLRARQVILAGGALGTVELLARLRQREDGLPRLSARVGDRVRTNSEVLMGVTSRNKELDMSQGVAITSVLRTDPHSTLEPTRFGSGSGFLRVLATPHAPGSSVVGRLLSAASRILRAPLHSLRALLVRDWAKHTAILLYMRTHEGYIRLRPGRKLSAGFRIGLISAPGEGPLPTADIPEATQLAESFAREVDGYPGSIVTETLFGIPTTAHVLGGACMGAGPEDGVIDHRHRVFGYPGLYVIDGSAMSANPGVNPSLSITALAERAMSFIPEKTPR
jgi:cholesterol oxidase